MDEIRISISDSATTNQQSDQRWVGVEIANGQRHTIAITWAYKLEWYVPESSQEVIRAFCGDLLTIGLAHDERRVIHMY